MFDFLPQVCFELRKNLVSIYWIMIGPLTIFLIILEYFKSMNEGPNIPKVIKRVLISIVLLVSFDECLHLLSTVTDGITQRIGGLESLKNVMDEMNRRNENISVNWVKFKEYVIFTLNVLSYIISYLGIFVASALIHFVWSILYIVSPLMILMYISEKTAYVTSNLYKSLISVATWKILWSILAVLLLKFITSYQMQGEDDNFMTTILINLFIGISMLFIPIATKSLIGDGLNSMASNFATIPSAILTKTMMSYGKMAASKGLSGTYQGIKSSYQNSGNFLKNRFSSRADPKRRNKK